MSSIWTTNGIRIHALPTGTVAIKELQCSGQGRLVTDRPTVYLPTHDPVAVARLTQRQVVSPSSMRLPA